MNKEKLSVKYVVNPEAGYDYIDDFYDGLALVKNDNMYGYITRNGKELIPCIHKSEEALKDKLKKMIENNQWQPIKNEAKKIMPSKLKYVSKNGKIGFVDENQKVVIPFVYDEVGNFNEGLAFVCKIFPYESYERPVDSVCPYVEKWGCIDETGKEVIPLKYRMAEAFVGGIAIVFDQEYNCMLIDKNENVIVSLTDISGVIGANDITGCAEYWQKNRLLLTEKNNKVGLLEVVKNGSIKKSNKPEKKIRLMDKVNWFAPNGFKPKADYLNKRSLARKVLEMSKDDVNELSYTEYKEMCDIFKVNSTDFNVLRKTAKECFGVIYDFRIGEWQPLEKIALLEPCFEKLCIVKADLSEAMVIAVTGDDIFKGFSIQDDEALVTIPAEKQAVVTWIGKNFNEKYLKSRA